MVTYFIEPKMGQSYRLLAWPSAHISIRLMSVQKVPDATRHIFQQPTCSEFQCAPSLRAKYFTVPRLRLVLFFVGVLFGLHLYSETATRSVAKPTVDVAALEATIDMKRLPRQAVPSEVYQ